MGRLEPFMYATIIVVFVTAASVWPMTPATVTLPIAGGLGEKQLSRFEAVWLLPISIIGAYAVMRWVPLIDPLRRNYESFASTYVVLRAGVVLFLSLLFLALQLRVRARIDFDTVAAFLLAGLFFFVGALLPKLEQAWFVGIRTPWTLSSKLSWIERTPRANSSSSLSARWLSSSR